ncbi:MAG: hypothetical protein ACP5KY_08245 [Thermoproteus sp.]
MTIATAVMGARRYIADWREVEGWIETAGLRPARSVPRNLRIAVRRNGTYIGLFELRG